MRWFDGPVCGRTIVPGCISENLISPTVVLVASGISSKSPHVNGARLQCFLSCLPNAQSEYSCHDRWACRPAPSSAKPEASATAVSFRSSRCAAFRMRLASLRIIFQFFCSSSACAAERPSSSTFHQGCARRVGSYRPGRCPAVFHIPSASASSLQAAFSTGLPSDSYGSQLPKGHTPIVKLRWHATLKVLAV
eukprot:COSAG02_NODE_5132_length_4604_cov_2.147170_4_plen_193_part_00